MLWRIDIDVHPGEFLRLIGHNGGGKPILMNIMAVLEEPSECQARIGGKDVIGVTPVQRDIAMLLQSYSLYLTMRVYDNIGIALKMCKVPKAERDQLIRQVAAMLQIEPLLQRRPAQWLGGQRQRVAMGSPWRGSTALFLFDEPLSDLDAKLRVEKRAEIKRRNNLAVPPVCI